MIEIEQQPPIYQPPINTASAQSPPAELSSSNKKWWRWGVLVVLFIVLLSGAYWLGSQRSNDSDLGQPAQLNEQMDEPVVDVTYDRAELLFMKFIPSPTNGSDFSYQAWLFDADTNQQRMLDIPNLAFALKRPTSPKVFFTQLGNENTVSVKDVVTGDLQHYEVINHPDAEVREEVALGNINGISPDGSMFIYSTFFVTACPPFEMEPGFEGGYGPCGPDPDPNFPGGYYLYDIKNGQNTHLGMSVLVSAWDLPNGKMYFNDIDSNKGLQVFDLQSKSAVIFDRAETFGYGAFPMLASNLLIKIEGQTGNQEGQDSSVVLSLTDLTTRAKTVLDSGSWASIQSFASIAPDESKFIYERNVAGEQGRQVSVLHIYDLQSKQLRQLTPPSTTASYSIYGYWPDSDHFITTVNETGADFNNFKNSLVKIDVNTGVLSKLIEESVYRFHIN